MGTSKRGKEGVQGSQESPRQASRGGGRRRQGGSATSTKASNALAVVPEPDLSVDEPSASIGTVQEQEEEEEPEQHLDVHQPAPNTESDIQRAITASFESLRSHVLVDEAQDMSVKVGGEEDLLEGGEQQRWNEAVNPEVSEDSNDEDGVDDDQIYALPPELTGGVSPLQPVSASLLDPSFGSIPTDPGLTFDSAAALSSLVSLLGSTLPSLPVAGPSSSSSGVENTYIPALSRPRASHMTKSYASEINVDDAYDADHFGPYKERNDRRSIDEDAWNSKAEEGSKGKGKRRASYDHYSIDEDIAARQRAQAYALPTSNGVISSYNPSSFPSSIDYARPVLLPAYDFDAMLAHSPASSTASTKSRGKKRRATEAFCSSDVIVVGSPPSNEPRRRTEIPAVEGDASIRPYGCNYTACLAYNAALVTIPNTQDEDDEDDEFGLEVSRDVQSGEMGSRGGSNPNATSQPVGSETSFRTIRELVDHCAIHRKRRDVVVDGTAFRCSLDPCGKIFKSVAGLRWHFQNASNSHFFTSMEEGEDRPTKKFKLVVAAPERNTPCPMRACNKSFKQGAGLAYHLTHTSGHRVTGAMLSVVHITVASKTRWWLAKQHMLVLEGGEDGAALDEGDPSRDVSEGGSRDYTSAEVHDHMSLEEGHARDWEVGPL